METMVELSAGVFVAMPSRVLRAWRPVLALVLVPVLRRSGRQRGSACAEA